SVAPSLPIPSRVLHLSYSLLFSLFFFNDTATTEIYTLSLHDALPILIHAVAWSVRTRRPGQTHAAPTSLIALGHVRQFSTHRKRSEEHTSELQSLTNLVCRLLLEKKKKQIIYSRISRRIQIRTIQHIT